MPVATLPTSFRMPKIERYTGVRCPRIHLKLYNIVMRALGLNEAQLHNIEMVCFIRVISSKDLGGLGTSIFEIVFI